MKRLIVSTFALSLAFANMASAQEDDKWFDMKNCDICQCMSDHMELMTEMKWEAHKIDNGMVMVTVIPDAHKATMEKVHNEMMMVVAKLEKGEPVKMCGFCNSYGKLMELGATFEELDTIGGKLTVVTADDPEVVEQIHKHCDKSMAAHEEMMKEFAGK